VCEALLALLVEIDRKKFGWPSGHVGVSMVLVIDANVSNQIAHATNDRFVSFVQSKYTVAICYLAM
jgi:hypothetical protein